LACPIERTGEEAILPEMADFAAAHVEPSGIVAVGPAEGEGEGGFQSRGWRGGARGSHQAIAGDGDAVSVAVAAEQVYVELAVRIVEEDGLAVVAALGDVMPAAGQHDSRILGEIGDHVASRKCPHRPKKTDDKKRSSVPRG